MKLLIENGSIVTVNTKGEVFPRGYLYLEDDRIVALDSGSPPDNLRDQADTIIDASLMAVMPGMVNAHTHLFQIFLRGLADDLPLLEWLKTAIWPVASALTEEDAYVAGLLGFIENIRSGATSIVDRLDIKSVEHIGPADADGFTILTSWDVYGSVRHWGHTHYRCNAYKAWLTIIPTQEYWKIADIQLMDEERVM
jgi:cytosine/adenosine deaminase-related metal-dependent hydrolase